MVSEEYSMPGLNLSHITHLLVTDAERLRNGNPSIAPGLEHLLAKAESPETPERALLRQGQKLWARGFGRALGYPTLNAYRESLPMPKTPPRRISKRFPIPLLVEARVGLIDTCRLAGLLYDGSEETFVAYDKRRKTITSPYWIRLQDGRMHRGRSARECRKRFARDEVGLTAFEGVALYLQDPTVVERFFVDLPGSVHRRNPDSEAFLGEWDGIPGLYWAWNDHPHPECGSASRWRSRR
ncbi:hypothetical protein KJ925_04595 [Patescibacteria group bacterium]|nr:hypothetical protein [Patescibacteria group bacterium]